MSPMWGRGSSRAECCSSMGGLESPKRMLSLPFRTKPTQRGPRRCVVSEILEEMAAKQSTTSLPANVDDSSGPFTHRERLLLHFLIFLIGSWNLVIIDLATSPDLIWFWPPVIAWATILVLHLGWVLMLSHRGRRRDVSSPPERPEPTREGARFV